MNAEDAAAWLDGMVPYALRTGNIPGAVIVIVQDGRILVAKGYGFADIAGRRLMSPSETLIRPGSVSKLFTWTTIMQLVEQGRLNLDADVNRYIDFRIPDFAGKPLTLRAIMTHTTGFEEASKNLVGSDPARIDPLDQVVKRWVPRRILPPGQFAGYSNYAVALAGYIVQRVSGERFEDYVARHILTPLQMTRSTFAQPVPAGLRGSLANGYDNSLAPPTPFETLSMSPAGALSATADDMARFMIAHLQDGRLGDARILLPDTARMMHRTITRLVPPLNGIALGFYEQNMNGHEVIAHAGDTNVFHSQVSLFIDDGIGIFIAMNGSGNPGAAGSLRQAVLADFADRYFPAVSPVPAQPPARAAADARLVAGLYQSSRRPDSTLASIANLFGGLRVVALPNGDLSLLRKIYRETSPFLWHEIDGHDRVSVVMEHGRVTKLADDAFGYGITFTPMPGAVSPAWLLPAVTLALLAFAATLLWWPLAALIRRHYAAPLPLSGDRRRAYRAVSMIAALPVAAALLWMMSLSAISDGKPVSDVSLRAVQTLTLAALLAGGCAVLYQCWAVWRAPRSWAAKIWSLVLLAAIVVLGWTVVVFHLVGGGIDY